MVTVADPISTGGGFGPQLRRLREAAGLTLAQLGERCGMAATAIARLERGEREPTWSTFVRLADSLGADLGEFRQPQPSPDESPQDRPMGKRK